MSDSNVDPTPSRVSSDAAAAADAASVGSGASAAARESPRKRDREDASEPKDGITVKFFNAAQGDNTTGHRIVIRGPITGQDDLNEKIKKAFALMELSEQTDKQLYALVKPQSAEKEKTNPTRRYAILKGFCEIVEPLEKQKYTGTFPEKIVKAFFEDSGDLAERISTIGAACAKAVTARTPAAVEEARVEQSNYVRLNPYNAEGKSAFHISIHTRLVAGWALIIKQIQDQLASQTTDPVAM